MESRIKGLLEKYWQGETAVEEERLIKDYFKNNPDQSPEGLHFGEIENRKRNFPNKTFDHPGRKISRMRLTAAAAVLIILIALPFVFQQNDQNDQFAVEDPMEAFEVTRTSLMMVSEGLNKGKTYSKELTKFNVAQERIESNY